MQSLRQIPLYAPSWGEEEKKAVADVMAGDYLNEGQKVREFEKRFAEYVGAHYCILVPNGALALSLAIQTGNMAIDRIAIPDYYSIFAIETDALYPTSVYAKSKVETEQAIQNMPYDNTVILRFATAYGLAARFRPDLILHEFIKDAWTKKLITLNGPNFYRPLCHVDDIARAIIRALNIARPKSVYNIGNTAHNFTKLQLAEMIQEQLPDCAIAVSPSIPDPRNYKVSFEKARKDLFFETIHNPKDEIAKIVNALKDGLLTFEDQKIAYAIS